jgi:signal transduction histidine kinase
MNAGSRNISYLFHLSDYKLDTLYSGMEFISNDITHTVFIHDNMVLLVSSEKSIFWDKISFLVVLFLGQLILSLLPIFLSSLHYNAHSLWRPGFQESIQFFVTILITLTVISSAFLFFRFFQIQRSNDLENTQNRVSQKTNKKIISFLYDIEDITDLSDEALLRINEELSHFYELDFLDLNLYNKKGENVERYGKGVYINTFVNPSAIKTLTLSKTGAFVAIEFYNGREYKSMYETILNKKGEIIGYTNLLRYQQRQREAIDYKHAQFLTRFMSNCIIIILLTVISSIILIRYISRPLLKVTESLSKIKIGGELKEIKWKKDDELGDLVNTYNILIDRLKISASLIEKSSQEVAWKDMAKQVAHEIKNPLTPMRLTTQHLRRELSKKNIDKEKLEHYFSMIIQQVDTLTDIASSFSNFAKINQQEGNPEDLIPIIQNTLASFNETPNVVFHLKNKTEQEKVMSFVNKSQISQVFNNLIKNAIQAKKQDTTQTITIEIEKHGDKMWQIKVVDTGIGMSDEVKRKIFSLNFTTKTSGMGLGLAMVQRIIATWGGNIAFESTHKVGTTFFITLPKWTEG